MIMKSFRLLRKKSESDVKDHQTSTAIPETTEHTADSSLHNNSDHPSSPSSTCSKTRIRKQNSGRLPFYDRKSHQPLSPNDRALIAKHRKMSHCGTCGVQTHTVKRGIQKKSYLHMTNDDVYQGICIRCNPNHVPEKVWRQYKRDHSSR